jgi:predicted nucleic-acid-binding Zn-ribbon protein
MKILKTYLYAHEAHLDLAKLQDEGIEAYIFDENIVALNPIYGNAVGGIKLHVHDEDFEKALQIINADSSSELKEAYDEDIEPLPKCPKCGSLNIYQKRSWLAGLLFLIWMMIPFTVRKNSYVCLDCKHVWKSEGEKD